MALTKTTYSVNAAMAEFATVDYSALTLTAQLAEYWLVAAAVPSMTAAAVAALTVIVVTIFF